MPQFLTVQQLTHREHVKEEPTPLDCGKFWSVTFD